MVVPKIIPATIRVTPRAPKMGENLCSTPPLNKPANINDTAKITLPFIPTPFLSQFLNQDLAINYFLSNGPSPILLTSIAPKLFISTSRPSTVIKVIIRSSFLYFFFQRLLFTFVSTIFSTA